MSTPTIEHPTGRPNFTLVTTADGTTYAFSYRTCVGFNRYDGTGWTVRENAWGPTTGKHLNYLDGGNKAGRLDADTFAAALAAVGAPPVDVR